MSVPDAWDECAACGHDHDDHPGPGMTGPYYDDGDVTLHHGHALDVARTLETGSVRTIVTSPPYFGLRDYGHDDQLGAEPTVGRLRPATSSHCSGSSAGC